MGDLSTEVRRIAIDIVRTSPFVHRSFTISVGEWTPVGYEFPEGIAILLVKDGIYGLRTVYDSELQALYNDAGEFGVFNYIRRAVVYIATEIDMKGKELADAPAAGWVE